MAKIKKEFFKQLLNFNTVTFTQNMQSDGKLKKSN